MRHRRGVSLDRVTVPRVTILVGFLVNDDAVFLASDSALLHANEHGATEAQELAPKIWEHPSIPDLVWGFTGDGAVGARFNDWLRGRSPDAWEPFLTQACDELAGFNGEAKRLADKAELPEKGFDYTSVLLGGFLGAGADRKGRLVSLSATGIYPFEPNRFAVLAPGIAMAAAHAAWGAIAGYEAGATLDAGRAVSAVTEGTIRAVPGLDVPVQKKAAYRNRPAAP